MGIDHNFLKNQDSSSSSNKEESKEKEKEKTEIISSESDIEIIQNVNELQDNVIDELIILNKRMKQYELKARNNYQKLNAKGQLIELV